MALISESYLYHFATTTIQQHHSPPTKPSSSNLYDPKALTSAFITSSPRLRSLPQRDGGGPTILHRFNSSGKRVEPRARCCSIPPDTFAPSHQMTNLASRGTWYHNGMDIVEAGLGFGDNSGRTGMLGLIFGIATLNNGMDFGGGGSTYHHRRPSRLSAAAIAVTWRSRSGTGATTNRRDFSA